MKLFRPKSEPVITQLSEDLFHENSTLQEKVARLQQENHYLRRANKVRPHLRLIVRAEAAAKTLALWHCSGYRTGRRAALELGMPERTWFAGRALLMVARLHDGREWVSDDAATIAGRIAGAVEFCKKTPESLVYRLPKSKRPKTSNHV